MDLEALRSQTGGQLVTPEDPAFASARNVWNGMIDRRPAAVLLCRGVADIIAGITHAREHGMKLAVRGGGHNVAGFGTCDDGLVLDLSPMRAVHVDPDANTVRVSGGATWADVDRETQTFGLAVPGGIVSTTGVAGLTLGGGQGWLRRTHGMSCDSLLSAHVVTASGELVNASAHENQELFWALRGGGGNFGVVTEFEFRAYPVGPMVAFAGPVYPLEHASQVLGAMRGFAQEAPDEVNLSATFWTLPAGPAFPEPLHGRPVIVLGAAYAGPPEEGEAVLRPLREIEEPLADLSGTIPFTAMQQLFDPFFPAHELRYYWKSLYLSSLGDDAVTRIADFAARRPSALSMAGVWALGGALGRVDPKSTATGDRSAPYLLEILANWSEPAEDERNVAWARSFFDAMQAHGSGKTNLNFPGMGEDPGFVRAAFGANWERLQAVKRRYDPTNLFRLNQNIDPTG